MNRPDFVNEVVALAQQIGVLDPVGSQQLDQELRTRFGGDRVRIASVAPLTIEKIDAGLRARKPVAWIAAEEGVSRATIYRLLTNNSQKKQQKKQSSQ